MKHRLIVLIFVGLLIVSGLPTLITPVAAQSRIELAVDAGFDGYYRRGTWTAVRVSVSNTGDNLDGVIRVRTGGVGGLSESTYRTPIDLPQGARKQVFLYVPLESFESSLQVELVDQHDRVVARETASLRQAQANELLYAVVTESTYGAVAMTSNPPANTHAYQANWLVEDIPPLAEALAPLDVLMFHEVDTGTLRAEQLAAITHWVQNGGHLIVAGGDAWQRTTAGLVDLLPVELHGTVPVSTLASLADYLRVPTTDLDAQVTVTDSVPSDRAQVLAAAGDVPLIVRGTYGMGTVDFLAVDPNAGPLRTWGGKDDLWYTLIASTGQEPNWANGISDWSMAREATLTASGTSLPTFLQLCGFLVLYILLIGPINYLVLKQVNRRELAWFTIPVFILLFSLLAYRVGFNLRGNTPTVNRLAVVHVQANSEDAQVIQLVGVQSPRRRSYNIAVERGFALRTLPEVGTGLGVPATINESTRYVAEDIPIDAGTIASFVAEGYVPAPQLELEASWQLSDAAPHLVGQVTNRMSVTLEDAVILVKGESRYLGMLDPGETAIFDIELGDQDPGPLVINSTQPTYRGYYGSPWANYGGSPGWCFNYRGNGLTLSDVMRGEQFSCEIGRVSDREQEVRRRYRLLAALVQDSELSGGRDAGAYLFAWNRLPAAEIELINEPHKSEDTSLYVFDLPVAVEPATPIVEIPPGLTTWSIYPNDDSLALLDVTPTRFQVNTDNQAAFQFMPMPALRLAEVTELGLDFAGQGPLEVDLWNWLESNWEPVTLNPDDTLTLIADPAPFVGPENAVNVRVVTDNSALYNQVDHVTVAYRGQLR